MPLTDCVRRLGIQSPAPYDAFISVVERDVRSAQAAVQLVLAQPSIGSQLVDNLNASIHLRAVLTDLFLLDEVLKLHARAGTLARSWRQGLENKSASQDSACEKSM